MSMKIGMIGVGGIGQHHLQGLLADERVKVTAVCDVNREAAMSTAERIGASGYTSWQELLTHEKLDALFVCVPPFAHEEIEEQAAAKGIHLFVEKPIGLDMHIVAKKQAAMEKAGIITSTGYCLRYLDIVQQAREYLADKQIALVRGHYLTKFVETPWWRQMGKSGGQLVEQATHWSVNDLGDIDRTLLGLKGSPTIVAKVWPPEKPKGGEMLEGTATEQVERLMDILREKQGLFRVKEGQS